jgi:hypothetical protein
MTDPITLAVVAAGGAAIGTLVTILLTPRLQHVFWTYQRQAEARVAAIRSVNELMAEFITGYIDAESKGQVFTPTTKFFQAFQVAAADIKALFPDASFRAFKEMEEMIGPNLGPKTKGNAVDDFIRARDRALKALYRQAGLAWGSRRG